MSSITPSKVRSVIIKPQWKCSLLICKCCLPMLLNDGQGSGGKMISPPTSSVAPETSIRPSLPQATVRPSSMLYIWVKRASGSGEGLLQWWRCLERIRGGVLYRACPLYLAAVRQVILGRYWENLSLISIRFSAHKGGMMSSMWIFSPICLPMLIPLT